MCDVSDGFRLCTCASDAADWTLTRRPEGGDIQLDGMMVRGLTLSPSEDDELQALFVIDGLEAENCFDFDYRPKEGDVLTFHTLGPQGTAFHFIRGHWRSYQDPPTRPMELQGRLELAAERGLEHEPVWAALFTQPLDVGARAVAIDWLLETGRIVLAEWLRREEAFHQTGAVHTDFRSLARKISLPLRARLARSALSCHRRKCPGDWTALVTTKDPLSRRCLVCRRQVILRDGPAHEGRRVLYVAAPSVTPPTGDGAHDAVSDP